MAFGNGFSSGSNGFGSGFGSGFGGGSNRSSNPGSNITSQDLLNLAKQYNIDPTTGQTTNHPILDFLGKAIGAPLHVAGQALDYVNRPLYAMNDVLTNAFKAGKGQASFDPLGEAYKGITGQEKNGWGQTLEAAGVPQGPTVKIPFINHDTSLRGILGFAGDTLLNPANLVGLGVEGKIAGDLPGLGRVFLNSEGQKALSGLSDTLASGLAKGADHAAILDQLPNELRTAGQRVIDSMPDITKYAAKSGLGQENAIRQAAKEAYFEHLGTLDNPLKLIDQGGVKLHAPFGQPTSVIPQTKINSTAQAVFDKLHALPGGAPVADTAKYLVQAPSKVAAAVSPTAELTRQGYGDVAGLAQMEQGRRMAGNAMGNAARNELDSMMKQYLKNQGVKSIADLQVPGMAHINANLAAEANPLAALSAKLQMANENPDLAKALNAGEQKILQRAQELASSTRQMEKDSGFLKGVKGAEDVTTPYIPRGFSGSGAKDFLAQHSEGGVDQIAPEFKNISFLNTRGTQQKAYDELLSALHSSQAKGMHPDVTSAYLPDLVGGRVAAGHKAVAQWQGDRQLAGLQGSILSKPGQAVTPEQEAAMAANASPPKEAYASDIASLLPHAPVGVHQSFNDFLDTLSAYRPEELTKNGSLDVKGISPSVHYLAQQLSDQLGTNVAPAFRKALTSQQYQTPEELVGALAHALPVNLQPGQADESIVSKLKDLLAQREQLVNTHATQLKQSLSDTGKGKPLWYQEGTKMYGKPQGLGIGTLKRIAQEQLRGPISQESLDLMPAALRPKVPLTTPSPENLGAYQQVEQQLYKLAEEAAQKGQGSIFAKALPKNDPLQKIMDMVHSSPQELGIAATHGLLTPQNAKKISQDYELARAAAAAMENNSHPFIKSLEHNDLGGISPAVAEKIKPTEESQLPQHIQDILTKLRTPAEYNPSTGAGKAYKDLTNLQKSLMVFTPANWIRNAVSNPINSGVAAYQGPFGAVQALLDAGKKGVQLATTKEGEIAPGVAKDSAMADALMHGGFNASMLNPATQGLKTPGNITRQVNQSLEDPARVALYQHMVQQGLSPLEALGQVNKIQGDYLNQPGWMKVVNDIMPFTSWTAHNIPLQLESMAHNPGAFSAMANVQKNSGFTPQEEAALPAYDKAGFHLKGDTSTDSQGHQITQVIHSLGLPVEDLQRLDRGGIPATIEQSILGALSPALRVPLELATNQDFYRGQDLNKEGNLLGNKAAGYPDFLKNLVDYANHSYTTKTGQQKTQAYANPTTMTLMDLIPGMSLFNKGAAVSANPGKAIPMSIEQGVMPFKQSPVDLSAQEQYQQQDAQKQLLQALADRGILKQFTNTYNPATVKPKMAAKNTAFGSTKKK